MFIVNLCTKFNANSFRSQAFQGNLQGWEMGGGPCNECQNIPRIYLSGSSSVLANISTICVRGCVPDYVDTGRSLVPKDLRRGVSSWRPCTVVGAICSIQCAHGRDFLVSSAAVYKC